MKATDKQNLQVIETYVMWNGTKWVMFYEIMLQPKGETLYMVERTHMTGDIIGREFISPKEREALIRQTKEKLNND